MRLVGVGQGDSIRRWPGAQTPAHPPIAAPDASETARIDALRGYDVLDTAPEPVFDQIAALAADLFDTPVALVTLLDAERQWVKARFGTEAGETPRAWAFCNHVVAAGLGGVLVVEDAHLDLRFADNPLVTQDGGVRFYAGAPLISPDGHGLGALCVIDVVPRSAPPPRMLERLRVLAGIVVDELELRRANRALAQRREQLERAETAIADSEARYRQLAEHSSDLTVRLDLSDARQIITYASPGCRRLGWAPEDIIGRSRAEFIHPDDLNRPQKSGEALAQGATLSRQDDREFRIRTATGDYVWMEAIRSIVRNDRGEPVEAITVMRDIGERRAAQTALADSERRFRKLAENASDAVVETNAQGVLTYVSPSILSLSGFAPEELIGRSTMDLVHPDDRDRIVGMARAWLSGQSAVPPEGDVFRLLHKDGSVRWMEGRPTLLTDPRTGRPSGIADMFRDVTARVAAEQAQAESDARYRLVTEASRDLILKYELDGGVVYASSAARQFGYEPEQLIGVNGYELIHPDDREHGAAVLADLLRDDGQADPTLLREHRLRRADGSWVWMEGNPAVVRDAAGRPVAIVNSLRDISARKAMEAVLEASEARYRGLAEASPDMIIECDLDGSIVYASPACQTMSGVAPEALIGRNAFALIHPDDSVGGQAIARRIIDSSGAVTPAYVTFRTRHASGRLVWMETKPAPIFDPATGAVSGFINVIRDITDRIALEAELEAAREAAEAAAAVKGDFLANMTHELRTPLNAIIGFSGLLQRSITLSPGDARQVALISDASQTLLGVVNDVLDFSKLEAGAMELDAHAFDPRHLAESTAALLSGQADAKGLTLSVVAEGVQGPLLGDGARLRQVLLNFVSNAIKFTPRGEVRILVSQSVVGDRRRLRIEVRDSGIGVPPDQVDAIFGRFTQADASVSRQHGGTGLGLAICKRIIEALDGQIGVASQTGQGSTFWFEVTMPPAEASSLHAVESREPTVMAPALRLLVVEDNAVNRELICALLSPFDLRIDTADDGVAAVEAASRGAFDVILMDVQMPNMDGLTATRRIRAAEAGDTHTPIIAMTANVLPEQVARCLDAGMDDHLGKPINPLQLLETLARWSTPADATV
jgi:PAS domain S-box-containing protein